MPESTNPSAPRSTARNAETRLTPETEANILAAVRSLRYGTVEVTVHDARVVQVSKTERVRFDPR